MPRICCSYDHDVAVVGRSCRRVSCPSHACHIRVTPHCLSLRRYRIVLEIDVMRYRSVVLHPIWSVCARYTCSLDLKWHMGRRFCSGSPIVCNVVQCHNVLIHSLLHPLQMSGRSPAGSDMIIQSTSSWMTLGIISNTPAILSACRGRRNSSAIRQPSTFRTVLMQTRISIDR